VDREVLSPDLLKRKLRVKVPDSLPRAIDPQDVRRLLAVIQRPRDRAMVLILLRTGMRIGELLNTTLSDVNMTEKRIEIFESQKNRVGRVVYLADDACQALEHWLMVRRWKAELTCGRPRPLSYEVVRSVLSFTRRISHKGYATAAARARVAQRRHGWCLQLLGHSSVR
jgi:integrase